MEITAIIGELERRRTRHLEQAKDLERAISTLKRELGGESKNNAELPNGQSSSDNLYTTDAPIPWTQHIRDLFQQHIKLDTQLTRELLAEKGLPAFEEQYAGVVQATLARLMRIGELERIGKGTYQLKSQAQKRMDRFEKINDEEAEPDQGSTSS